MPQPNSSTKSQKERDIQLLPPSFKVCIEGNWKEYETKEEDEFTVIFQNELELKYLSTPYVNSMKEMKKNISMKFKAVGRKVTEENILLYLLDPALPTIAEFTTKQLIKSSGDSNNVITPDKNLGVH